jgi:outer membrane protein OmpA-like peptidoglycan-associated protein
MVNGEIMNIKKISALQNCSILVGCILGLSVNVCAIDVQCEHRHEACPLHYPKTSYSTNYQEIINEKTAVAVAPVIGVTPTFIDDDIDGVANVSDQCPATPVGQKVDTKGCSITFTTLHVNFTFASNVLPLSSEPDVEALTKFLKDNTASKVSIIGHTDNNGIDARNQPRSEARAKALADKLISNGIDANRITTSGYGSKQPIATNATDEGQAQNRRIEVIIK